MEEARMLKKIEETRKQADKMQKAHDESNDKYMKKLEHRQFVQDM